MPVFSGYIAKHSFRILYILADPEEIFNQFGMYVGVLSGLW